MNIIGIVCEYNPFHNGHAYHLMMSRQALGEDAAVICVMSGDFMQRGEAAVYSKFARAEAACRCGANLVIELPLPWSLSSAESFARGSVGLLSAMGATHLSFGSETGEIEPLKKLSELLIKPEFNEKIKDILNRDGNLSFAAARQIAAEEELGELAQQLELPNNILAIEYLKAIYELKLPIIPMTVQRFGSGHDREFGGNGPKSASELRNLLKMGKSLSEHIPVKAEKIYLREREQGRELTDKSLLEIAMLSRLRMFDEEYFENIPDGGDGAGRRLYKAVREEGGLDGVLSAAKTKRYALSRIRRMCLNACLGVKKGMNDGIPPYARVLAADSRGCEIIKEAGKKETIPIITKPASVKALNNDCQTIFNLGASAHDFYVLGRKATGERRSGADFRQSPVIIK